MAFDVENLLKSLWPLLKPRLAAALAKLLHQKVPQISESQALDLALWALDLLDDLWEGKEDALVAEATAKLQSNG